MTSTSGHFGIIVSGGPAPGINSAISSVVIEAQDLGYQVKGFLNGFRGAATKGSECVIDLSVDMVSRIGGTGGSILGTSRFNPFAAEDTKASFISTIREVGITHLVVIGGDGSAYLSHALSQYCPDLLVCHIPKTIDNDLDLPHRYPSFGFETARYIGTKVLGTLLEDAKTTNRWFVVTSMGRQAGFLALGLGLAAGATLTLIPEEFEEGVTPEKVAKIVFDSINKRAISGKRYGVALLAEGIINKFDPTSVEELKSFPIDELGRIRYSDVELDDLIALRLRKLLKEAGLDIKISTKNIGYELRCYEPISFDIEYTKFLGYGAVKYLSQGQSGFMVVREHDELGYIPLSSMLDGSGRIRSRKVDMTSEIYKVARSFMIR